MAEKKAASTQIIVRRGALRRYDALTRKTADLPVVITWDRRQTERRKQSAGATDERRATDRRQQPPFTWELAEFVVVAPRPPLPSEKAGRAREKRKAVTRSR